MSENDSELAALINHISQKVHGIGPSKAGTIATYFTDLDSFLSADGGSFRAIRNQRGNPVLSDPEIEGLLEAISGVPNEMPIRETWVGVLVTDFVESATESLNSIQFDSLELNPLIVRALDMRSANQLLEFFLYQTITRSVVTSWGMRVQDILVHSGATKLGKGEAEGFDIKKIMGKVTNYIQIKSGTNTMNVDMIRYLNQKLEELETGHPEHKGVLGLTYGRRNQVSSQIMGNLDRPAERLKVGEELWEFVSGEKGYFYTLLEIISRASHKKLERSFSDMIGGKFEEIKAEWRKRYNGLGEESVDKFLSDYLGISKGKVEGLDEKTS